MKGPTPMGKAAPSLLDLANSQRRKPGKPTCAVVTAVSAQPAMRTQVEELMAAVLAYAVSAPAAARACAAGGLPKLTGQVFQHHRERQCDYCAAAGLPVAAEVAA